MTLADPLTALSGIEAHPHALAVLGPAVTDPSKAAHAYLFHGPSGAGKRAAARAFAGVLLAEGAKDPDGVAGRVERGSHPDLTWVTPSGATEMLVEDIDEPVVAAAARTPFESSRRVFVIEAVERLNDQAANRMLKTLEEPASFVHLVLVSDRSEEVLPTISSRCQRVRFQPLPPALIAERLEGDGEPEERVQACARLALGDAGRAELLTSEHGDALRASAELLVRSVLAGAVERGRWTAMLELAREAGARAGEETQRKTDAELELAPPKERKKLEREGLYARRRIERRARTRTLDLALCLAELWLRDVLCVREGAPELIHAVDRRTELEADAGASPRADVREAIELVADTRLRLELNVSEELAVEALAYRLYVCLAGAAA